MASGIYKIEDEQGRTYYGSSNNLKRRLAEHKKCLRANNHNNGRLQNSWNKYGEEYFTFQILFYCQVSELFEQEQNLLDNCEPYYNISKNADCPMRGVKRPKEFREKMRRINIGKTLSTETRRKMSESRIGRVQTEEHKKNSSIAQKERYKAGYKGPMYGKKHTEATLKKMSKAKKGKRTGPESSSWGRKCSDETKAKISKKNKGSVNTRAKPVDKIDMNTGLVIKTYGALSEVVEDGYGRMGVQHTIKGRTKGYAGFYWEYA